MRMYYRLPEECFGSSVEFFTLNLNVPPTKEEESGIRMVCEIFNDGHHLYLRRFEDEKETPLFTWLPYSRARPLKLAYFKKKKFSDAHLTEDESITMCLDGHLDLTALVMFEYTKGSKVRVRKYLVIREGTSIRFALLCQFRK